MKFLSGVILDQFIEPHHAYEVRHPVHPQVRFTVSVHGQHGERSLLPERQEAFNEGLLLEMGPWRPEKSAR